MNWTQLEAILEIAHSSHTHMLQNTLTHTHTNAHILALRMSGDDRLCFAEELYWQLLHWQESTLFSLNLKWLDAT